MITGLVAEGRHFAGLHPVFADAFAFLQSAEPAKLPPGPHDRDGFTAVVIHTEGKGTGGAPLEFHRRDIDVHVTLSGHDEIGWRPLSLCAASDAPFDTDRDIGFVDDPPDLWIPVPPGRFAIFFPEDGNAPLAGTGAVRKIVLKVAATRF